MTKVAFSLTKTKKEKVTGVDASFISRSESICNYTSSGRIRFTDVMCKGEIADGDDALSFRPAANTCFHDYSQSARI